MSEITRSFIKSALAYLGIGVILGGLIAIGGGAVWSAKLVAPHAHINLLGWVSMLMFGVAYHIIPRFHGRMLHSDVLAQAHFWLANVGLIGFAISLYLRSTPAEALFGAVWGIGAFIFIFNLLKTMSNAVATPSK